MRAPSLTRRLVLALTLGTSLLWCLGAGYASYASLRKLNDALDANMRQIAFRLLPLGRDDILGHESDDARAIRHFSRESTADISYQLTDLSGKVLLQSSSGQDDVPWGLTRNDGFSSAGHYRLYRLSDTDDGLRITIAASLNDRNAALLQSLLALLLPLLALIPLNALVIWRTVRRAMRPIGRLGDEIARRGGANLAPLEDDDAPTELRPIVRELARLMERLRAALDAERSFAANAAHELRTPIAGALAQTQRLRAEAGSGPLHARATEIEAALKRLAGLADKLLQIARVDAGLGAAATAVDLAPVLSVVLMDLQNHPDAEARIAYAPPEGPLIATMDPDAFAIALRNLVDNALKHGAAGGKVEVIADSTARTVRVRNAGPAVSAEALRGLTRRFARGESSAAAPGTGLGLSIADTIMQQSGGTLTLTSPLAGQDSGFEACLQLARRAPDQTEGPEERA